MKKKNKLRSTKTLATLLAISLILASMMGFYVGLASFSGNEEDIPKYLDPTLPYSYIIDTNTTHYFAYNGTTWRNDIESTNATYVHNQAFSSTPNGGSVLTKIGTYPFDGDIYIYEGTEWYGESRARTVTGGVYYLYGTIIQLEPNANIILSDRDSDGKANGITIDNILFDGTFQARGSNPNIIEWLGGAGLKLNQFHLTDCEFVNFTASTQANTPKIYIQNYDQIFIERNSLTTVQLFLTNNNYSASNYYVTDNVWSRGGSLDPFYFIYVLSTSTGSASAPHTRGNQWYGSYGYEEYALYLNASGGDINLFNHALDRTENCMFLKCDTTGSNTISLGSISGSVFMTRQVNNTITIDLSNNTEGITIYGNQFIRPAQINISMTYIKDRNDVLGQGLENIVYGNSFDISTGEIPYTTALDLGNATTIVYGNTIYNPLGIIANPVGANSYLVDSGVGAIADNTEYTCVQSAKTIYMQDADTFDVYVNGQLVFDDVNQAQAYVMSGETFKIDWTNAMDILKVFGV